MLEKYYWVMVEDITRGITSEPPCYYNRDNKYVELNSMENYWQIGYCSHNEAVEAITKFLADPENPHRHHEYKLVKTYTWEPSR